MEGQVSKLPCRSKANTQGSEPEPQKHCRQGAHLQDQETLEVGVNDNSKYLSSDLPNYALTANRLTNESLRLNTFFTCRSDS